MKHLGIYFQISRVLQALQGLCSCNREEAMGYCEMATSWSTALLWKAWGDTRPEHTINAVFIRSLHSHKSLYDFTSCSGHPVKLPLPLPWGHIHLHCEYEEQMKLFNREVNTPSPTKENVWLELWVSLMHLNHQCSGKDHRVDRKLWPTQFPRKNLWCCKASVKKEAIRLRLSSLLPHITPLKHHITVLGQCSLFSFLHRSQLRADEIIYPVTW